MCNKITFYEIFVQFKYKMIKQTIIQIIVYLLYIYMVFCQTHEKMYKIKPNNKKVVTKFQTSVSFFTNNDLFLNKLTYSSWTKLRILIYQRI